MATDKNLLGNQVSTMVDLAPLQASCPLQEPHPIIQDEANEMELGTTNPPTSRYVAHHHHLIQHQQLQKNILLVICSDRIINEVNFDKFRCAKLALKCLNEWPDNNMNKMCVAICSMLGKCI